MQKDLFEQLKTGDLQLKKKAKFFIPNIKEKIALSYENIIFISIAFIMCAIISFSLGVEKGRGDINYSRRTNAERYAEPMRKEENVVKEKVTKEKEDINKCIIQIAAFKGESSAREEVERLKKDRYNAHFKKSGSFYQVFIGGFSSRIEAQRLLDKLKNSYKDCYIKQGG